MNRSPACLLAALIAVATMTVVTGADLPEAEPDVPPELPGEVEIHIDEGLIEPRLRPEVQLNVPADEPVDVQTLRDWFAELGETEASTRDAARVRLMGMGRQNLDNLRQVVQASLPLVPSQAAVLRQIVNHVYLAGEPYETAGLEGFLGVKMQDVTVHTPGPGPGPDPALGPHEQTGIVIVERMPGFVGSRMLLDGDVVLNIVERPVRVLRSREFMAIVRETNPGQTLHFELLRQGQVVRVPVVIDPRPVEADLDINPLLNRRREKCDQYWRQAFEPLLQEGVS